MFSSTPEEPSWFWMKLGIYIWAAARQPHLSVCKAACWLEARRRSKQPTSKMTQQGSLKVLNITVLQATGGK